MRLIVQSGDILYMYMRDCESSGWGLCAYGSAISVSGSGSGSGLSVSGSGLPVSGSGLSVSGSVLSVSGLILSVSESVLSVFGSWSGSAMSVSGSWTGSGLSISRSGLRVWIRIVYIRIGIIFVWIRIVYIRISAVCVWIRIVRVCIRIVCIRIRAVCVWIRARCCDVGWRWFPPLQAVWSQVCFHRDGGTCCRTSRSTCWRLSHNEDKAFRGCISVTDPVAVRLNGNCQDIVAAHPNGNCYIVKKQKKKKAFIRWVHVVRTY